MLAFAETAQALRRTRRHDRKLNLASAYLSGLSHTQIQPAARFLAGCPILAADGRRLKVPGLLFRKLAWNLYEIKADLYKQCLKAAGDPGEVLAALSSGTESRADRSVPIEDADEFLHELAALRRPESKLLSLERYLGPLHPLVVKALVRIITGKLGIGLNEGDVLEALALAWQQDLLRLRGAYLASNDLGLIARQAATNTLPPAESPGDSRSS